MPFDGKGGFAMQGLKPGKDGKLPMGKAPEKKAPMGAHKAEVGGEKESTSHTVLHNHGDGTYHSEHHDGTREEHPDIGHALTHIGHLHEEGKHHHVLHDGAMMHSHGTDEQGQHDGTHDHANMEELRQTMDKFLGEEQNENSGSEMAENKGEPEGGLGGFAG